MKRNPIPFIIIILSLICLGAIFFMNRKEDQAYGEWAREQNIKEKNFFVEQEKERAEESTEEAEKENTEEATTEAAKEEPEVDAEQESEDIMPGNGTVSIVFTRLNKAFSEVVVPMMEEAGYKGVLVVDGRDLPGINGNISVERFKELVDSGWDYVVGWDGKGSLENAIDTGNDFIRDAGYETPKKIFFKEKCYNAESDTIASALKDYEIKTVIQHGEGGAYPIVSTEAKNGNMWTFGAASYRDSSVNDVLKECISSNGDVVINVSSLRVKSRLQKFRAMLDEMKEYEQKGNLSVKTISEMEEQ